MRFSKVAAVAVCVLVFAASANAAELFVSTSGNDANAGTLEAPFKTVNKAAWMAKPGDVINVRGGVYYTNWVINSKGTASARILFRPYNGEKVTVDGSGLASGTILVNLSGAEYVDFGGFEIRNSPFIGLNVRNTRSVRVMSNEIHHSVRGAIYVSGETMSSSFDVVVENNVAYNNVLENQAHNMNGGWAGTIVVAKTSGAVVRGNRVYNNDGEAIISLLSTNVLITGNETFDNFSQGVYLDNARFTTVDSNLIYSTGNTRYYRDGYPGQGIAVANEFYSDSLPSSDNTIINNIVIGTRWGFYYGAFEANGGLKNTRVANNTFHRTAQEIIRIESGAHASSVIENNIFHTAGGVGTNISGGGVTFRNNNWYGVNAGAAAGPGDVVGNPNFARAGGYAAADYRLTAGSAAIAAAADLSSVVKNDYFGTQRVTPFDIGAHQYSSGAARDTQAPSVPGGLRAVNGNSTTITLTWTASSDDTGVTGYTVSRNGVPVADVTGTTWSDTAVKPKTLYTYTVVAYDAAGNRSAGSAPYSVAWKGSEASLDTDAPTAPTNFRARPITSSMAVTLVWTVAQDNVGVTDYRVYQNGVHVGSSPGNAFTAISLTPGQTYSFEVEAVDAAGNVSPKSATTVTMPKRRRAV